MLDKESLNWLSKGLATLFTLLLIPFGYIFYMAFTLDCSNHTPQTWKDLCVSLKSQNEIFGIVYLGILGILYMIYFVTRPLPEIIEYRRTPI